jgi:hypothetical protein
MAKKKKPTASAVYDDGVAPQSDTRAAAEGKAAPKGESAKFWLSELSAADKREKKWRDRGRKVIDRYRDERDKDQSCDRRTNILWSNTELLKGVLFQTVGAPDVRRRFPKKGKDERAARTAALVLERSLTYCKDAYDLDCQVEAAVEDHLLPGRGILWTVYDADLEYAEPSDDKEVEGSPDDEPEATGVADQQVKSEHVYWEDYRTSAGRKEADIWWKARRHQYTRDELKKYFPEHADAVPLNAEVLDAPKTNKEDEDTFKRANVWEIWDRTKKERVFIAEEYGFILKRDDDPYKLKDFYPCPPALYSVKTTSSLTPIPEYTLYQDQCEELDQITTRLNRMIDALKRRGVYDAGLDGADKQLGQLADAGDNEFLPFRNFAGLMEKGGLKSAFQSEDLGPIITVVQGLYEQRATLIQTIYEVTGLSDIFRGASDPNETATAQRIKGQVGGMRIEKRKTRVQNFIRDAFRLKAEIIAEHFTREKLIEMTGIDMPLKAEIDQAKQSLAALQQMQQQQAQMAQQMAQQAGQQAPAANPQGQPQPGMAPTGMQMPPPPMPSPEQIEAWQQTAKAVAWEDVASILRSDQRRGYKVDIETADTNRLDDQEEKQSRIEFMTTMQGMVEKSIPMMMQVPELIPLMKENALFVAKAFKAGRTQEEAFEEAFDQLLNKARQAAQAGPPQDPKAQAEAEKIKADLAITQQKAELDAKKQAQEMQFAEVSHAADMQMKSVDLELKKADLGLKAQQMDLQFLEGQMDIQSQQIAQEREAEAHAVSMEGARADQEMKSEAAGLKLDGMQADQELKAKTAEAKIAGIGTAKPAPKRKALGSSPLNAPPPATSGLQQALMQMAQAIAQMAETNAQVLKAVNAPRSVKIVRDAAGRAAGAVQQVMNLEPPAQVMGNA